MMQLIFFLIFIISFLGILYMLWKKIPVLVGLPLRQRKKIKIKNPLINISFERNLHKSLSFSRILILKIERNISNCLQKLRAKKIEKEKDNYWQELKK